MRFESSSARISLQILSSSPSIVLRYSSMIFTSIELGSLVTSLDSIEEMMRKDARRAPTTFLYATDSRLRSSRVRSASAISASCFMYSTISSYRSACSASFAMYTVSGFDIAIASE